jgi:hypothetical protein
MDNRGRIMGVKCRLIGVRGGVLGHYGRMMNKRMGIWYLFFSF